MSNTLVEMRRFLRSNLMRARSEPITKIVLRHAAPGTKGSDVETFTVPEDLDNLEGPVGDILARAEEDANGMGGIQRYVLNLYEATNPKSAGRFPFRIRGQDEEFDDGGSGGEEAPNQKGLLSQLMRHNEANNRTMMMGLTGVINHLVRRLESSDSKMEKLIEQRFQMLELLEASKSDQHNRDMEMLTHGAKEERQEKIFGKIMMLMPAVLNKFVGKKAMDGDDPSTIMMRDLAESLTPEQFQALSKTLSHEQQIILIQLIQSTKTKKLPEGGPIGDGAS